MDYIVVENQFPSTYLASFHDVHEAVFGDRFNEQKLLDKPNLLVILAVDKEQVVGFKLGYEHPDGVFYSWLGGVHPTFQQQGIAKTCMDMQHTWCKQMGYTRVRTYGRNEKRTMLIVNLKAGFNIMSTFIDEKGRHKIVFEKALS